VIGLWLPVAVYMAAIYYGAALSQTPGPAAQVSDTVLHMAGYAGLALLTLRATAGGRWAGVTMRALVAALVIAAVHGATVEIEQMFVPTRFAEWRDLWNDIIGSAAALLAAWGWSTIKG
jgi:VanZ family protein